MSEQLKCPECGNTKFFVSKARNAFNELVAAAFACCNCGWQDMERTWRTIDRVYECRVDAKTVRLTAA